MIVVKVELWPFGEESKAKEIGRARIWNTMDAEQLGLGNYNFSIDPMTDREIRGRVTDHQRSRGFWVLLQRCLEESLKGDQYR